MITVPTNFGSGGAGLHLGHGEPDAKTIIFALIDEVVALRAAVTTLTAKLDTDFTAQNAAVASSQLDVDYASTVDPVAIAIQKGS